MKPKEVNTMAHSAQLLDINSPEFMNLPANEKVVHLTAILEMVQHEQEQAIEAHKFKSEAEFTQEPKLLASFDILKKKLPEARRLLFEMSLDFARNKRKDCSRFEVDTFLQIFELVNN